MLQIIEREWGYAPPASYAERVGLMIDAGFRQSLAPIEGVAEALTFPPPLWERGASTDGRAYA